MKKPSPLEERFASIWEALGGPALEREYRFCPRRRWRADFAHPASRTLIEIEGGVWNRGRHVSPQGFVKDAEKYLTATLDGWAVLRLTAPQINAPLVSTLIAYVRERHQPAT